MIQWGITSIDSKGLTEQKLPISYSSPSSYHLLTTSLADLDRWSVGIKYSASIIKLAITSDGGYHQKGSVDWCTIGY